MTEAVKAADGEAVPGDRLNLDAVLARFDHDPRAALVAALEDIAALREELTIASLTMSYGFARGWRPALEAEAPLKTSVAKDVG
ncbi:MAG: hypothetical protein K5872_06560 [Rhizobiaceae bacterium]|nr:hypothetical protein [Rhizobiaceae bacterium]MCV0405875.1 hypothetical protein [Rhizobiaceae bacterium]